MLCSASVVNGDHVVRHFTAEDGLPSMEVYDLHQDSYGYIWITTDRGVSLYDGYEFTNFSTDDGIQFHTNFKIFEDPDSNLWFTGFDGSISIWDANTKQFKAFSDNKRLIDILGIYNWVHAIDFSNNHVNFYSFRGDKIVKYIVQDSGYVLESVIENAAENTPLSTVVSSPNGDIVRVARKVRPYFYQINQTRSAPIHGKLDSLQSMISAYYSHWNFSDVSLVEDHLYFSTQDGLYVHDGNGGRECILPNLSISSSMIDKENYLWVSTTNNGVYVLSRNTNMTISPVDVLVQGEKILHIATLNDEVYLGTNKGNIIEVGSGNILIKAPNEHDIHSLKKMGNVLYASSGISIKSNKNIVREELQKSNYISIPIHDSLWFITNSNKYGFSPNGYRYDAARVGRVIDVEFLDKNHLLVARFGHLFKLDVQTGIEADWYEQSVKVPIVKEIIVNDSFVLLGTLGAGLQICSKDGQVLSILNKTNGMPSNMVNSVLVDHSSGRIWCCTNKGLSIVEFSYQDNTFTAKSIRNLSQIRGLPSNYLVDIAMTDDFVWIASGADLCRVPRTLELTQTASPEVVLEEFYCNGNLVTDFDGVFAHNENNIHIQYCGISLRQPVSESFYKYRLLSSGNDTTWKYTNERAISFINLQYGNYQFEVAARIENGLWSKATIVPFQIEPFILNRWEARWVMIGLLIAIIYIIVRRRYNKLVEVHKSEMAFNDLKMRINQLELDSLRGQMNPHFIFNALKSIQRNILVDDKSKANKLLTRFSKLIRSSLEFSRKDFVPITEEIEFLKNYLEIEMERMPGRFTYEMHYKLDELTDLLIPPLLLQPICENAVKHAFVEDNGKIVISINRMDNDFLVIQIEDNGIGIHRAPQKTKSHANSVGLEIVESRLSLLNEQGYACEMKVSVANPEADRGTKVEFRIPHL